MPKLTFLHDIVRARKSRVLLAAVLIGVSVWAFAPFAAYRVSSSAFINSEVMRVTAPIPGYLSNALPRKGQYIPEEKRLTLIKSYAADRQRLLEMEGQRAAAQARAELATQQLAEIARLDVELTERMKIYRQSMIERTALEIQEAEAEKVGCQSEQHYRQEIGSKMQGLADTGATSQIRSAEALAQQAETMTKCNMAAARLDRLKGELGAMEKGVFLRDAANDVPYSEQQRDRLFLRRQELELVEKENATRAKQLASDIVEERERVEHLARYDVTLPADYVVWSVSASPGSVVEQGQTVLDLTDCRNRFVAVELPEREFENIKPGDTASIRLIGNDEWRTGRVQQVRGSAARGDDRLLAAQIPAGRAGNITVEVSLPDETIRGTSNYCDIGRLADVRFHRGTPAIVESIGRFFRPIADLFVPGLKVAEN